MSAQHRAAPHSPWAPGSWHPARLNQYDSVWLTGLLIVVGVVRGYDYITPSHVASPSLAVVESAMPMTVWGTAFGLPAIALAFVALLRIHGGVWMCHWILAIIYAALAVGLGAEYITRPGFDGIRTAATLMVPAFLHLTIALRTGWRPLR